jgi:hypothetical protein
MHLAKDATWKDAPEEKLCLPLFTFPFLSPILMRVVKWCFTGRRTSAARTKQSLNQKRMHRMERTNNG